MNEDQPAGDSATQGEKEKDEADPGIASKVQGPPYKLPDKITSESFIT